jgi:hypothetical protein
MLRAKKCSFFLREEEAEKTAFEIIKQKYVCGGGEESEHPVCKHKIIKGC